MLLSFLFFAYFCSDDLSINAKHRFPYERYGNVL